MAIVTPMEILVYHDGPPNLRVATGMSMVLSNWIITPIKVGCLRPITR